MRSDLNHPIIFDGKPMVYSLIVPKKEEEEDSCSKKSLREVTSPKFFRGASNNSFLKV